ncbi:MAG TPA: bifunctional serine/threonine-protein kinase/formylglycine-generating enzyme family protein [Anaerolineales bacterium]|nr:bifunctional serine/threonine-protein kinase/formylglycine-generating enzyme family protein [Anaerolineales bacterium]
MSGWIGKTIGKVQIEKYLARGGMAEVYLGTHLTLDRPVAIKLLHSYIEEDPDLLVRFHREAKAVAGLRHPNIVQIYDFDTVDGHPYIVMEYLKGPPLGTYLRELHKRNERIEPHQVARLLKALTSSLDYAHEQGMIHRDIKPANILLHGKADEIPLDKPLTSDVEAVLTDFGLVRIASAASQTITGTVSGTPSYMSPEQARGDKIDHRTDIYSLGIVLYEMLAGRVPFEADSTLSIMYKQINDPPPPIPGISSTIQKVIDRALAKNPEDRHPTSRNMALDFFLALGMTAEAETIHNSLPVEAKTIHDSSPMEAKTIRDSSLVEAKTYNDSLPVEAKTFHDSRLASSANKLEVDVDSRPVETKSPKLGIGIIAVVGLLALAVGVYYIFSKPSSSSAGTDVPIVEKVVSTEVSPTPNVPGSPDSNGMTEIPAGTYELGASSADDYHNAQTSIFLNGFWIDQYQTTYIEYQKFLMATGRQSADVVGAGNEPVRGVTWDQAVAYCSWVNKRLPSEAEWEAAGRGPGQSPQLYPWGDDPNAGGNVASLPDQDAYEVGTLPFNKSPFGLYDMVGNVWEWIGDPYGNTPAGLKILRGGRYGLPVLELSYRLPVSSDDTRYLKYAGFRCAADNVSK